MKDFSGMGKKELRVACKEAGIKYSSLTVGGMRDALVAHHSNNNVAADVVTTDVPASINATPEVVAVAANGSSKGIKIEKDREERNGVKRPSAGGLCRAVWDFLDGVVANTGITPSIALVREEAAHAGWNPNNANIEYYQWRKFHGIRGRQPKA